MRIYIYIHTYCYYIFRMTFNSHHITAVSLLCALLRFAIFACASEVLPSMKNWDSSTTPRGALAKWSMAKWANTASGSSNVRNAHKWVRQTNEEGAHGSWLFDSFWTPFWTLYEIVAAGLPNAVPDRKIWKETNILQMPWIPSCLTCAGLCVAHAKHEREGAVAMMPILLTEHLHRFDLFQCAVWLSIMRI